jgi:diphthamide biosynthesis protein 3
LDALRTTQMEVLPDARRQMTATAAAVLAAHAELMERTIQVLERTKHGALARAGKARAEHLAKVAEGMEGKVRFVFPVFFRFLLEFYLRWHAELNNLLLIGS